VRLGRFRSVLSVFVGLGLIGSVWFGLGLFGSV
jgi:hypothetical protein